MEHLGYSRSQLGSVQQWFLFISYFVPVFSGTFADKFGFKKVLLISYLAYIPSILMLMYTRTYSGIAFTMITIGFAAGIFKPLVSGTVRLSTDSSNKTLGFGIFYLMVNFGASFGPIVAGKLRAINWNYAFLMAAIAISIMFVITLIFYKEPPKEKSDDSIGKKLKEIFSTVTDIRFAIFLILLGIFFWLPFWAFFDLCAVYVDKYVDTVRLFHGIEGIFGNGFARLLSREENGVWMVNGESVAHTGWIILICQVFVSKYFEKKAALPSFRFGLLIASLGFVLIGFSRHLAPVVAILGIVIFAVGEMITSPRIQEYITWIAPKEKAGLYMGSNFLATCIGAFLSGYYTKLFGTFENAGHPQTVWYVLAIHTAVGILFFYGYTKIAGEFKEMKN